MTPTPPEAPPPHGPDRRLRHLARDVPPPPDLEEAVLNRLVADGLALRAAPTASPGRRLRVVAGLAAALLLVAVGWTAGRASRPAATQPAPGIRQFLLLLYEDERYDHSPGIPALVAEYGRWADALREAGALVNAEKLGEPGGLLEGPPGATTLRPDGPVTDAGTITGYFVVTAADLAAARRIAEASPHLRHGGRIAIREIEPT